MREPHEGIVLVHDGDSIAEFDRLYREFECDGGVHLGQLDRHLVDEGGPTVVILDSVGHEFATYLKERGWSESMLPHARPEDRDRDEL